MKKMNKKGFAFSELLMVTVVIAGIFMIIYTNIFPIMGELENRKEYNDLSANYTAFYLRRALLNADLENSLSGADYVVLYPYPELLGEELEESTEEIVEGEEENVEEESPEEEKTAQEILQNYEEFLVRASVEKIILTTGYIGDLKDDNNDISDIKDYIDYLPYYKNLDGEFQQYRLIIKTETGYATTLVYLPENEGVE